MQSIFVTIALDVPRPLVFVSPVNRELRSARQIVANTLLYLGCNPVSLKKSRLRQSTLLEYT
jgi:hypothetical protein